MSPFSEQFAPGEVAHGRYRVVERVGTGGIATVYRAVDEQLGRTVALKVVPRGATDATERRRVQDEGTLLAAFDHPALVTLFDIVADDDGPSSTLVMQFVDGEDLSARIARGALPQAEVAEIGAAVAGALAFIHDAGVIHRDVKPANILLPSAGSQTAMLADFGIARLVDSAGITATGTVMGTASYLSPEQARGADLTDRSDIYSLGLVLLEALTGVRAFPGSAVESVAARLGSDPRIPTELGVGWVDLLGRMVDADPTARPSAAEAQRALATVGGPTATLPLPAAQAATERLEPVAATSTDAPSPRSRSRWLIVAVLAAALIVAAVVFAVTRQSDAPQSAATEPPVESSPAASVQSTPEPLPPIVYPAVEGELGESLAVLQAAAGEIEDDATARAVGEQVLVVTEAAAAGDLEGARTQLDALTPILDAAELNTATRQSVIDAAETVRTQLDTLIREADKPGNDKPGGPDKPGKKP